MSIKPHILPLLLGVAGLVFIFVGIFQIVEEKNKTPDLTFEAGGASKNQDLIVDVEGAVINPGVYKLLSSSRMVDALASAGGLAEDADRLWVEKNINLAQKLTDGLKIYVPRVGEEILSATLQGSSTININTASSRDLEDLPGIGSVTADKIIEGRPYQDIGELLGKKIIGQKVFDQIKQKISAY